MEKKTTTIVTDGDTSHVVLNFNPKEFSVRTSKSVRDYVERDAVEVSNFKVNTLLADQIGINELQKNSLERQVQEQALQRVKDIQEKAYKEAFDLGSIDGAAKAFEESRAELSQKLNALDEICASLTDIKTRLVVENEAVLIKLVYAVVNRLVMREIKENPGIVTELLSQTLKNLQSDERIVIKLAADDLLFIQTAKEKMERNFEFLQNARLEVDDHIRPGGCLIETNYGSIDATLEERLENVWKVLESKLPKVKLDPAGSAS